MSIIKDMSSRRVKQVVYGLIYLIFWCAIGTGIYFLFLKPAPSCFDGIQNEGEQGVDCGGPCAKLCLPSDIQPVAAIGGVSVFTPLAGHATLLVDVVNPNSDFAADTFSYTFDLYDASGNVIQSIPGTSFIYADQTKYLVVPNAVVSGSVDHAGITIGNINWVPTDQMGVIPQFSFKNIVTAQVSSDTLAVSGQIIDSDPSSFANIEIIAVLKAPQGNVVGVSNTELNSIAPNQAEDFSVMYPVGASIDPSQTQVYAYAER